MRARIELPGSDPACVLCSMQSNATTRPDCHPLAPNATFLPFGVIIPRICRRMSGADTGSAAARCAGNFVKDHFFDELEKREPV